MCSYSITVARRSNYKGQRDRSCGIDHCELRGSPFPPFVVAVFSPRTPYQGGNADRVPETIWRISAVPYGCAEHSRCNLYSVRWFLCLMQAASIMTYSTFYKGISTWAIHPRLSAALGDNDFDANDLELEVASRSQPPWRFGGRIMYAFASSAARLRGTSKFCSKIGRCPTKS